MKIAHIVLSFLLPTFAFSQITITEIGELPNSTSNNAVCEGWINNTPYLFSFGGIDSTKTYSGIHLKSYSYNISNNTNFTLPSLPDTLGKVAMGASNVKNKIYIIGGYHVYASGNELSSDKVHRFDPTTQTFLSDGSPIPKATDDHVQAVWRDSLIYVISGWKDVSNIPDVQIYNPSEDEWMEGTSLPNSNAYKSFGASGSIIGDTIYYFGGSSSSSGFPIQNRLRKGVINANNPTEIIWSNTVPNTSTFGYRMASTTANNQVHWVGGSSTNYNYDGIAYDGSGGVEPNNRDLWISNYNDNTFNETLSNTPIPMDLRGIAKIEENTQYIAGGMLSNQNVTNKVFKIEWTTEPIGQNELDNHFEISIVSKTLNIISEKLNVPFKIYNTSGQIIFDDIQTSFKQNYSLNHFPKGLYFLKFSGYKKTHKIIL